jgi:Domain of Unknown Function with PDB structure (DUF3857)/Transglutaminase-like superfamily
MGGLGFGLRFEAAAHPLFTPGCTVVLLSGLPGDIESENSYREQMQNWVDMVARSGQAKQLFVLCDQPEALRMPSNSDFKAIKADRKAFVNLGQKLATQKAPLVVIVWGHGGQQRTMPVLHVRGPRLTPDDFAAMADQAGAPASRWVLLFRGSGAFAKKLSNEHSEIISSELETAFTSDPISIPLLIKLLSDGKERSFDQVAADFGRATAAWYEQRNLARTEEPTLWKSGAQPRLLATAQEGDGGAEPAQSGKDLAVKANESQSTETNKPSTEAAAQAVSGELSGAWTDIKKVAPEKYPEADGVILRQSLRCILGSSPAVVTEQEKFIQILTAEGKQFGDFDVSFTPPEEELEFLDCEVLSPDGKLARLDQDAAREVRDEELGDYRRPHRKFFSLPGVVSGAVIHVRFRTQWKDFPLPSISMPLPVGDELPAIKSFIQVSVSKDTPFHFAFQNLSAADPAVRTTGYSTSYSWELENVPAHRDEILSSPGRTPRLLISTFPDWQAFAEWYGRISRLTDEVTPEIAAKATQLTTGVKTDREKVYALYNYVTALRYVAVPLGINSVRPHAAANVLQNQYGDCKDKANLLNTLLHALHIDAHLVLVPRFSQAYDAVPGLAFNHAISRVQLGAETLWIDTTDDVCRFGMLPPGDAGRKVLPIDSLTTGLAQLPDPLPGDHRLTITGQIAWSQNTEGMPIELKALAKGYPDYEFRATAREAKEHRASLPLLAARFRPLAGSFALSTQKGTPVSSLEEDFSWQAEGACIGLVASSGQEAELRPPFWVPREWDLALHQRHNPLFLNQGYPLTLEQDFEFALPPGSKAAVLPKICENSQAPLRWRVEWATLGRDKIRARFSAQLQRGELSDGETAVLQDQLRTLLGALGSEAKLTLP